MSTQISAQKVIELEKKHGSFNYAPLPVVFSKGLGVHLWDLEGKKYLDFMSGYSAVSQGHCHPRIVKALQEQAATLTLVSRAVFSDQLAPLVEYATELFGFQRILMMNTGAEAFETACKLARKWGYERKGVIAGQAKIIVCNDNFHGRTTGALSASSNEAHHRAFAPVNPGFIRIPFDDLPALVEALADPNVVAFCVEPIQGESGINVPASGYLKEAFELCRVKNVLFIADEVQTGIARTGKLLACHHEGFRPDVLLLGKALSGGTFPISAVLADDGVMAAIQLGDHGSTFGGSPLAARVALESLKVVVEEKLAENAVRMGEVLRERIRDFHSPIITEVRGKGLLNAVVFDFGGDKNLGNEMCLALLRDGLVAKTTRPHIIRFAPPLVIDEDELQQGLSIFAKVVKEFEARVASLPSAALAAT